MTYEDTKPPAPLPRWLVLPLGLGTLLILLGLAMPWLYPAKSLWTDADAQQHTVLAAKAHTADHIAAIAQHNKLPTAKDNAAEARYWNEQFKLSEKRLLEVSEGGSRYGQWLLIAGGMLTAIGVVTMLILRRE